VDRADDIHTLPDDLPVPEDDGAADHLLDAVVPSVGLRATTGEELPPGWNAIPGARGCTLEACGWTLLKRLTLVIDDGRVTHVFYPVFPPDAHAAEVLSWLRV
jgi:hypothetical protein